MDSSQPVYQTHQLSPVTTTKALLRRSLNLKNEAMEISHALSSISIYSLLSANALHGDFRQWLKLPFTDPMLLEQGGRSICDEDVAARLKLLFTLQQGQQGNYIQRWSQHWHCMLLIIIPYQRLAQRLALLWAGHITKMLSRGDLHWKFRTTFKWKYTEMEVAVSWHFLLWKCYRHNGCGCIGSAPWPKKKTGKENFPGFFLNIF